MIKRVSKEFKTRAGGTMTEAEYLAWIRSALRSKSLRWPPRTEAIKKSRRVYVGPNKLQKWECQCALCKGWFKLKEVDVDHHPIPAGRITSIGDISQFVENLYCEVENLRVLCKPCHEIHTLAEKLGITFEQAEFEKAVNQKMKSKDLLDWLAGFGYTGASVSNAEKRKALVKLLLRRNV